jgi:hypothetical protein
MNAVICGLREGFLEAIAVFRRTADAAVPGFVLRSALAAGAGDERRN